MGEVDGNRYKMDLESFILQDMLGESETAETGAETPA